MRTEKEIRQSIIILTDYLDEVETNGEKHDIMICIDSMLWCLNERPHHFPELFPEPTIISKGERIK